ncbi:DUF4173 domain-containing protein [Pontimicrobium sp. SW4]|uniref:DUF4173 domain-containing protein n=1 Tax=Pontimicrobium sp. SW4 TaxID=3153519 RepID=A0AAU7BQ32_9FLAO
MKHIIIIISSILFSTLFYNQQIGLNISIFSVLTVIILAVSNTHKFKNKTALLYIFIYLFTAALVFIQYTNLSILANIIAFLTLIGSVTESKSSIYVQWYNGIYTSIVGYFHRRFIKQNIKKGHTQKKTIDVLHLSKLIGIPLVFIIGFIVLYKNGNPIFNDIISKINFDFINLQWLLFTVLGYYLFSNIFNPVQVDSVTNIDLQTGNTLHQSETFSIEALKKEKQLGTILLLLLNLLIVFYLATDIISLNTINSTHASVLSSQVHSGINTLIASIVIAIVIILYFFRGDINFFKDNKMLKKLSYTWIFLNAVLVILIATKNYNYIALFGLTYKRIGVNIYLFLTLIGLITTLLKVSKVKNFWFLLRINTRIAFGLLILFSIIDWDYSITKYNINHAPSLDLNYLINLSDNNAVLLNKYRESNNLNTEQDNRIFIKHRDYVNTVNNRNWQEYTYSNFKLKATANKK